jgi:hypothetical protein
MGEIPDGDKKGAPSFNCLLVRPLILPVFIGIPEKGSAGRRSVVRVQSWLTRGGTGPRGNCLTQRAVGCARRRSCLVLQITAGFTDKWRRESL